MGERGMRLKLGAFIAGTLAVLAGLVVFFGRAPELFSNKARYDILFPEAPGIAAVSSPKRTLNWPPRPSASSHLRIANTPPVHQSTSPPVHSLRPT
jgi:hypothetical protein